MRLMILNGPNLNRRARATQLRLDDTRGRAQQLQGVCRLAWCVPNFRASNYEGVLVDMIQSARATADAIIINPAGYSFERDL